METKKDINSVPTDVESKGFQEKVPVSSAKRKYGQSYRNIGCR